MQSEISTVDRSIIKLLVGNSRITVREISREIGISQPTVILLLPTSNFIIDLSTAEISDCIKAQ